jgi:hypothetical protein
MGATAHVGRESLRNGQCFCSSHPSLEGTRAASEPETYPHKPCTSDRLLGLHLPGEWAGLIAPRSADGVGGTAYGLRRIRRKDRFVVHGHDEGPGLVFRRPGYGAQLRRESTLLGLVRVRRCARD